MDTNEQIKCAAEELRVVMLSTVRTTLPAIAHKFRLEGDNKLQAITLAHSKAIVYSLGGRMEFTPSESTQMLSDLAEFLNSWLKRQQGGE